MRWSLCPEGRERVRNDAELEFPIKCRCLHRIGVNGERAYRRRLIKVTCQLGVERSIEHSRMSAPTASAVGVDIGIHGALMTANASGVGVVLEVTSVRKGAVKSRVTDPQTLHTDPQGALRGPLRGAFNLGFAGP